MPQADEPEKAWRSQDGMHIAMTTDELCAMARSREKLDRRVTRAVVLVIAVLAALLLYNVYRLDQPWIRFGQAWTLAVIIYMFAPSLDGTPAQRC